MTNGVAELPVFAALFGSINTTVEASIVPSSVSLAPTVTIVATLSSFAVFPKSSTATGASFIEFTVISKVLDISTVPSVIL